MIVDKNIPKTTRSLFALGAIQAMRKQEQQLIDDIIAKTLVTDPTDLARSMVWIDIHDKILDYLDILEDVYANK